MNDYDSLMLSLEKFRGKQNKQNNYTNYNDYRILYKLEETMKENQVQIMTRINGWLFDAEDYLKKNGFKHLIKDKKYLYFKKNKIAEILFKEIKITSKNGKITYIPFNTDFYSKQINWRIQDKLSKPVSY